MLFLIAFLVSLFFFSFYVKLVSVLLFVYKSMVYYEHYKVFKEFILFLFYLSMLIDNVIWHARVGSFYALKPLLQYKSTTRKVPFSLLLLALSHIIKCNLHVHYVFNCTVTKNMGLVIKLPNIFFFICIVNLLCPCGDIETNPVPKYSSLTFCNWNLNGLTAHDSTKILLIHAYILQHNYIHMSVTNVTEFFH